MPFPLAERPDAELLYLASHAHLYPAAVGEAAAAELLRRGLLPNAAPPAQLLPGAPPAAPETAPPARFAWLPDVLWPLLRGLIWPTRRLWAVPLLIDLNLLAWLAMTVFGGVSASTPTGRELVAWGSNVSGLSWPGQPWRLITSLFVHAGFMHLLLNLVNLWLLGALLEARTGGGRLLAAYLASGLAASVTTLWYHAGGVNSVGASGAIFGLYGVLLALLLTKKLVLDKFDRRAMLGLVLYLVLSNLLGGLTGNVDNSAHLGGLALGLLVAGPLVAASLRASG